MKRLQYVFAALFLAFLCGCPKPKETPKEDKSPLAGVKLKLIVVDDPQLAAAAAQVRGEWNTQTEALFEVEHVEAAELAEKPSADAIICPSHMLGPLATKGVPAALPRESLLTKSWSDVFEMLSRGEASWGAQTVAVPFGSPVFVCYYRADLFDELKLRPPQTWSEYREVADRLAEHDGGDEWSAALEPLAPGSAGLTLLARAAAYVKHRENYSALFDIETMEPLIAGKPMVRALEELVAVAKLGKLDPTKHNPASVRQAFWQGRCGMAISWPTATAEIERVDENVEVGFVRVPGSDDVFDVGSGKWEKRWEDERLDVPLLGIAGRVGIVCEGSKQKDAARELLFWLSDREQGRQVCSASSSTTLFRTSQMSFPREWVEKPVPALTAARYAETTQGTLSGRQWVFALRIPGRAEYLAALDEAVLAAVSNEKTPEEALQAAADKWQTITERLGTDSQKRAYQASLGL